MRSRTRSSTVGPVPLTTRTVQWLTPALKACPGEAVRGKDMEITIRRRLDRHRTFCDSLAPPLSDFNPSVSVAIAAMGAESMPRYLEAAASYPAKFGDFPFHQVFSASPVSRTGAG